MCRYWDLLNLLLEIFGLGFIESIIFDGDDYWWDSCFCCCGGSESKKV